MDLEKIIVKVMMVTPQTASEWLKLSEGNPRWKTGKFVNRQRVDRLKRDIASGKWNMANNTIAFDEDGVLCDGHHRLTAISEVNIACPNIVVWNLPKESARQIDANMSRSDAMRLGVANTVAAVPPIHAMFVFGTSYSGQKGLVSTEVKQRFLDNHNELQELSSVCALGSNKTICKKAAIVHAAMCAYEYGVSITKLERFFRVVNTGFAEDPIADSCAITFRNQLLSYGGEFNKSDGARKMLSCIAQAAIHDYVNEIPRKKAYRPQDGFYFNAMRRMGRYKTMEE